MKTIKATTQVPVKFYDQNGSVKGEMRKGYDMRVEGGDWYAWRKDRGDAWSVTHGPTGMKAASVATLREAKQLADALAAMPCDFTSKRSLKTWRQWAAYAITCSASGGATMAYRALGLLPPNVAPWMAYDGADREARTEAFFAAIGSSETAAAILVHKSSKRENPAGA